MGQGAPVEGRMTDRFVRQLACAALAIVLLAAPAHRPQPAGPAPRAADGLAKGARGMVSSAHPLATEAGLRILKAGGNAFDAAVAVAAALNVVEPQNSGVG